MGYYLIMNSATQNSNPNRSETMTNWTITGNTTAGRITLTICADSQEDAEYYYKKWLAEDGIQWLSINGDDITSN